MAKLYYSMIRQDRKTINDVPENLRASVEALLNAEK